MVEELGRFPEGGERLVIDGVEVEVEEISNHVIASIVARPIVDYEEEE